MIIRKSHIKLFLLGLAFLIANGFRIPVVQADPLVQAVPQFEGQIAYIGADGNVWLLRGDTGERQQLTTIGSPDDPYHVSGFSPDGSILAYCRHEDPDESSSVYLYNTIRNSADRVIQASCDLSWSPDGKHLVYALNNIFTFNLTSGDFSELVSAFGEYGLGEPTWSPDGRWIGFRANRYEGSGALWLLDLQTGERRQWTEGVGAYSWSPDGSHIVYDDATYGEPAGSTISIATPDGQSIQQLYSDPEMISSNPYWLPDGRGIVFTVMHPATRSLNLMRVAPNGSGAHRLSNQNVAHPQAWSPDGSQLLVRRYDNTNDSFELLIFDLAQAEMFKLAEGSSAVWGALPRKQLGPITGQIRRVSIASNGTQGDNASGMLLIGDGSPFVSTGISISSDGRYVVFTSQASNLVAGDNNYCQKLQSNCPDVFVHDLVTGNTERISVAADGTEGNGASVTVTGNDSSISADGRYVIFISEANNLVQNDTNETWDMFIYDRATRNINRVALPEDTTLPDGYAWSTKGGTISANGNHIAFIANLIPTAINQDRPPLLGSKVLVYNQLSGQIETLASLDFLNYDEENPVLSNNLLPISIPVVSGDGNKIAVLMESGISTDEMYLFIYDFQTKVTEIEVLSKYFNVRYRQVYNLDMSSDGRFIAILGNLHEGHDQDAMLSMYDHQTNTFENFPVSVIASKWWGLGTWISISDNGQCIALRSNYPDSMLNSGIEVYNWQTKKSERIPGNLFVTDLAISSDCRFVVFTDFASNLVANDTNTCGDKLHHDIMAYHMADGSNCPDVFVYDRFPDQQQTQRISGRVVNTKGKALIDVQILLNGARATISGADGRYTIDNIAAGQYTLRAQKDGYQFDPQERKISLPPDAEGMDFVGREVEEEAQIQISHIEITQVIQDDENNVPLITGKPTVLRVYLYCNKNCDPQRKVGGRVQIENDKGQKTTYSTFSMTVPEQPARWQDQRGDWTKTVNFYRLPLDILKGRVTFTVFIDESASYTITRPFDPAWEPSILFVPVGYQGEYPDRKFVASGAQFAEKILPTPRLGIDIASDPLDIPLLGLGEKGLGIFGQRILLDLLQVKFNLQNHYDYIFGWLPDKALEDVNGIASDFFGFGSVAIVGADELQSQNTFAHELGHLLGLGHKNTQQDMGKPLCFHTEIEVDQNWKKETGGVTAQLDDYGLDVQNRFVVPPHGKIYPVFDFMSYCGGNPYFDNPSRNYVDGGGEWISKWSYDYLFRTKFELDNSSSFLASHRQGLSSSSSMMLISGLLYQDNRVEFSPTWIGSLEKTTEQRQNDGPYCLETRDASANLLERYCFDLSFTERETGQNLPAVAFGQVIPYNENIVQVVIKHHEAPIGFLLASSASPTVEVIMPNGGDNWGTDDTATIAWQADDPDNDQLTYVVLYSGDGENWMPLGLGLTETQLTVNPQELPGGQAGRIRVLVSDGFYSSQDESDAPFVNSEKGPRVFILMPKDDQSDLSSNQLWLQGSAFDLEDGVLNGASLRWSSNIDGELGVGSQAFVEISKGLHTITLVAADSQGNTASAQVQVNVSDGEKPTMPGLLEIALQNWRMATALGGGCLALMIAGVLGVLIARRGKKERVRATSRRAAAISVSPRPIIKAGPEIPNAPRQRAQESQEQSNQPLLQQGVVLVRQGQAAQAMGILRQALAYEPNNAEVWLWLGWAAAQQKDWRTAERCFLKAQQLGDARSKQALDWLKNQR